MADTARDTILAAIRRGKPDLHPLPPVIGFPSTRTPDTVVADFMTMITNHGGQIARVSSLAEVQAALATEYDLSLPTLSYVANLALSNFTPTEDLRELETLNLVVLAGQLGVAENAAIWLNETDMGIRALPFITINLAVVVSAKTLVGTLHEAYRRIDLDTGFGSFIAGPSKTADIEQSLVIGAHGSKSLSVFLLP